MDNPKRVPDKPLHIWRKTIGVVFDILFYIAILALIAGSTMFAFSNDASKSIFGYRFYTVLSDSMKPAFSKGDMIIVKLNDDVKEGDVITFNPGNGTKAYLTHRIVGFTHEAGGTPGNYVITRGDANDVDDPPTPAEQIIGKQILHIPFVGSVIKFIQGNFIPMMIVIVGSFFLIILLKSYFEDRKENTGDSKVKKTNDISTAI